MASFLNRSTHRVSVKNRPDLDCELPFNKKKAAHAHVEALRGQGHKATCRQGEDTILVRIRTRGYEDMFFNARSYEEAEAAVTRIEPERKSGLFIDYTRAHKTTLAKLFERYTNEECPKHKGCDIERWTLKGFIEDSRDELAEALAERQRLLEAGLPAPCIRAKRVPRRGLKWLHKPLAKVLPTDVEEYIHDRLDQEISPSTIDRELDLISQVITWTKKTLRIHLEPSPLYGVRRPRYFNERDRRLQEFLQKEHRLFASAREEDRLQAHERAIQERLAPVRAYAAIAS